VLKELEKRDDELLRGAKKHKQMFMPLEGEFLEKGVEIINRHPRLLEQKPGRNGADPWVVALAVVHNAVVVTQERISTKAHAAKIPNVCAAEKVECITVLELIRRQGWTF
jgi:hypothetical protein